MSDDQKVCLCFHVTRRKIVNFLRVEKPQVASQLSQCQGAGTGCGWCRPFLKQLFEEARRGGPRAELPSAAEYARQRGHYVRQGRGTPPPGAAPLDSEDPGA